VCMTHTRVFVLYILAHVHYMRQTQV